MPLSKDDPALDYDGSWGDASEGWPELKFSTDEEATKAYVTAHRVCKVPYGSYVLVGKVLRLETQEYVERVRVELQSSMWADCKAGIVILTLIESRPAFSSPSRTRLVPTGGLPTATCHGRWCRR